MVNALLTHHAHVVIATTALFLFQMAILQAPAHERPFRGDNCIYEG